MLKAVVIAMFASYWLAIVVIWLAARPVFDEVFATSIGRADQPAAGIALIVGLAVFLAGLSIGVVRGWRWTFWVILLAFLAGVLRILAAGLELLGVLPAQGPPWYVALTGVIGLSQFVVALLMLAGYRRAGMWSRP